MICRDTVNTTGALSMVNFKNIHRSTFEQRRADRLSESMAAVEEYLDDTGLPFLVPENNLVREKNSAHNQVLNELYHDRARLERVVDDAVTLMRTMQEYLSCNYDENWNRYWDENSMNVYLMGLIDQFDDSHGKQE